MSILNDSPLHTLWSRAASQPGYNKEEWKALERKLHAGLAAQRELAKLKAGMGKDY